MSALRTEDVLLDCARAWHDRDAAAAERLVAGLPVLLGEEGDPTVAAEACLSIAMVAWRVDGDIGRAASFVDQGLALVDADAAPSVWMRLMNFGIFAALEKGEWVDVIPMALAVRRRAALVPLARDEAVQATNNMAWVLWQLGDHDAAERLMRESVGEGEVTGQELQALGGLISLVLQQGRVEEADALLVRLRNSPGRSRRGTEVRMVAEAQVALARGRHEDALTAARNGLSLGLALAEDQSALFAVASEASLGLGRPLDALRFAQDGLAREGASVALQEQADLLHALGRAAHAAGEHDLTLEALTRLRRLQHDRGGRSVALGLSRVLTQLTDRVSRLESVEFETRSRALERANAELEASRLRAETALQERTRLERAFKQTAMLEAAGLMAGGLAQDLNNLLTVVYDAVHGLQERTGSRQRHLETLTSAADDASSLVRRLLRLTRQSLGEGREVVVSAVLRSLEEDLARMMPETQTLEVAGRLDGAVWMDPAEFEQVVTNLVLNASHAAGPAGRVRVSAEQVERGGGRLFIEIAVEDDGPGVPAELRARIFEPFFSTQDSGGSGLGLSVSRSIVESVEGSLWLDSSVTRGARFVARLPLHAASPPGASGSPPRRVGEDGTARLLLVEDEPMVRATLARQLKRAGFVVTAAEDGLAGLEAWRASGGDFATVLTDVVMPRMSGTEFARTLLEEEPDLPLVIMSGYTAQSNVRGLLERDNVRFLAKPFTPGSLQALLESLVAS